MQLSVGQGEEHLPFDHVFDIFGTCFVVFGEFIFVLFFVIVVIFIVVVIIVLVVIIFFHFAIVIRGRGRCISSVRCVPRWIGFVIRRSGSIRRWAECSFDADVDRRAAIVVEFIARLRLVRFTVIRFVFEIVVVVMFVVASFTG